MSHTAEIEERQERVDAHMGVLSRMATLNKDEGGVTTFAQALFKAKTVSDKGLSIQVD